MMNQEIKKENNSNKYKEMLRKLVNNWETAYPTIEEFIMYHQELIDEANKVLDGE